MAEAPYDTVLQNFHMADGGPPGWRLALKNGRIAAILPVDPPTSQAGQSLELGGDLLLPGLVDGHMHLDKTLFGLPWTPHAAEPFRMSRIAPDAKLLPSLPLDTAGRAGALIGRCVAHGKAHIRTHADITPIFGLSALEGVLAAREAHRAAATVQIVTFPQAGVMRAGGKPMLDLLDAAIGAGAELVGGIDPCEVDRDPRGQFDGIFAIAEKRGVGVDIHLHEPGELGLFSLLEIRGRVGAHGMAGRATISHGFCLGAIAESKQKAAAEMMASCGVALVTHGAGSATMPPLMLLRRVGVRVFCGNDAVRDTWSPYGNADMLECASVIGWREDLCHDPLILELFSMVTSKDTAALGISDYGIAPGNPAHFFTIAAENIPDAIGAHPPRKRVFHAGRLMAADGIWSDAV